MEIFSQREKRKTLIMAPKYSIITYGCLSNRSDSERIATLLESIGYEPITNSKDNPDLTVVNVCSIRQSAVDRTQEKIHNLKLSGAKKILLTGCILDSNFKKLSEKADIVLKIKDLPKWPEFLKAKTANPDVSDYFQIIPKRENSFSAFIPIMTGCDNFCSYCVVPYTRGREQSRPAEELIQEVRNSVSEKCKEIWLLGQNVNSYKNNKENFSSLLEKIKDIPGDFWIRFISSHPKDFGSDVIKTISESQKITKYINLPVQSGDDEILEKMNRPYTVSDYKKCVFEIKEKIPGITLSTDVIVGFPGETKKQFQKTVDLFKEIRFDMAYISRYSPRPGTPANNLSDNVSSQEKKEREEILNDVLKETALERNKGLIGQTITVLAEKKKGSFVLGKTQGHKTVKFQGSAELLGTFIPIKIIKALPWGLKGEINRK